VSANILQAEAWIRPHFKEKADADHADSPLSHIRTDGECLLFVAWGGKILIINPRDFPAVIKELKKYPFTFISGVNTLFNAC